jgi:starch phosphorylase
MEEIDRRGIIMIEELLQAKYGKDISKCSNKEIFDVLVDKINELSSERRNNHDRKKLYYISAEFLTGRMLGTDLVCLGLYDEVRKDLAAKGRSIEDIEELENEPSLGNGGLGRLASCYLDSTAHLDINAEGLGLLYHFGLFRQTFFENEQCELPDRWLGPNQLIKKTDRSYTVNFGNKSIASDMYEIDIPGKGRTNSIHLFDAQSVDETIVKNGTIEFDKNEIEKNITLFLYPDDSDEAGRLLRIYQEYFMTSNAAQYVIDDCMARGSVLTNLSEYAVIQINDTHPSLIIPELIRLLELKNIPFEKAVAIVTDTCAYTNHTILAEALETWPISFLETAVPVIVPVIKKLNTLLAEEKKPSDINIIDQNNNVHMAFMDINYSHSINGVASLHTDILKNSELSNFYKIYPEKFNNKTNGITFRRFLFHSNPELTDYISELIGNNFKENPNELEKLDAYRDNKSVLEKLNEIKSAKKVQLSSYLSKTQSIFIDPDSIYDIQAKRLHEYKRQQLNALYIINKYLEIRNGILPQRPITAIFCAKAAPAYTIAKDIIHLILCLSKIINSDPIASKYLRVVMPENYNITLAEKLIPSCDISEQISLASKEASGTGNMKFMLNGAVTLGTMDGANVEISNLVGPENIYIFGDDSDTVIKRYASQSYCSRDYYRNDPRIHRLVNFITGKKMLSVGKRTVLEQLRHELLVKDWFMTFPDFNSYNDVHNRILSDYNERLNWSSKALINISKSAYFSSDRAVTEYNHDIWHIS